MESINTRIIELSIKKRMKRMNLTALLLSGVCLLCHPLQAQQSVDACDGRTYKVGDTLPFISSRCCFTSAVNRIVVLIFFSKAVIFFIWFPQM